MSISFFCTKFMVVDSFNFVTSTGHMFTCLAWAVTVGKVYFLNELYQLHTHNLIVIKNNRKNYFVGIFRAFFRRRMLFTTFVAKHTVLIKCLRRPLIWSSKRLHSSICLFPLQLTADLVESLASSRVNSCYSVDAVWLEVVEGALRLDGNQDVH